MEELQIATLSPARDIKIVMKEAKAIADTLNAYADSAQLYKKIGDSKHLMIEGWLMCGAAFQVIPRTVSTEYLEFGPGVWGFKSVSEAVSVATGQVVGRGEAICTNDEERWGLRSQYEYVDGVKTKTGSVATPRQQLMSMAQTRANSKALSSIFRWVAKLGGFSGTPGEEMAEGAEGKRQGPATPQRTEGSGGAVISDPQMKRMYAIAKKAGIDESAYRAFLKRHGFDHSKDVTKAKYDVMIAELENPAPAQGEKAPDPQPEAKGENLISEQQRFSIVNAAEAVGWSPKELEVLLGSYKVGRVDHLPADKYAAFLADVKKGPK